MNFDSKYSVSVPLSGKQLTARNKPMQEKGFLARIKQIHAGTGI